jgi:uncharacterized YigZ family protein
MAQPGSYKTLRARGSDEFIIHKSRFIGYGAPCETEEAALAFLREIREKHKDASHNCYAYVIGLNAGVMRYSDDGEPGGTAGLPIIEVMKARGVVNCAVVVTRYFGGVLLGAGGLVRAYAQGAKTALDASGVVVMEKSVRQLVEVDYSTWQRLEHYLKTAPCQTLETEFTDRVLATLMMKKTDEAQVLSDIIRLTDARAEFLPDGDLYYPWPESEPSGS